MSNLSAALKVEMNCDTLVLPTFEFAADFACDLGDAIARIAFHADVAQYRRGAVPVSRSRITEMAEFPLPAQNGAQCVK
jgi:hypothetical protein